MVRGGLEAERFFQEELTLSRRQALQDAVDITKRQLGGQATPREVLEVITGDLELLFPNPKPKRPELGRVISVAGIDFYPDARVVFDSKGERKELMPQEFKLLQILTENAGSVVGYNRIAKSFWGDQMVDTHRIRSINSAAYLLKQKIGDSILDEGKLLYRYINVRYGAGYVFSAE